MNIGQEDLLPSERYLGLLRDGAFEWNLDREWQDHLRNTLQAYDGASSPEKSLGGMVAAASMGPLMVGRRGGVHIY